VATPFTYPFRYVPHPLVVDAARALCERLDADPQAGAPFAEGKMLGVLITDRGPLYAFSGLAGGRSTVEGFVPPIFDTTGPWFKEREALISAMPDGPAKGVASAQLQDELFSKYRVRNALGQEASIKEIFALRGLVPPGGTGDCAAPKLLNYAYLNGLKPIAMGEFWYGRSHHSEVREQGRFYPSCTGKCGPLLTWMMQGLDVEPNPLDAFVGTPAEPVVIYEDKDILVVDKPSGMLSVPGRTAAPSLLGWLRERYGSGVESCHRLDMDTSGLMVFARSLPCKVELERQFAGREVQKEYRARLIGSPWNHAMRGTIALPLALDYYDRPRQIIHDTEGKKAITEYEVLELLPDGSVDVLFRPHTGRSHQLRVHAAHPRGLGHPIKGDALYGAAAPGERLWLRASRLCFTHPVSEEKLVFGE